MKTGHLGARCRPSSDGLFAETSELLHQFNSANGAVIPSPHHMLIGPANQQFVFVGGRHL
jgi:hypothetical protein